MTPLDLDATLAGLRHQAMESPTTRVPALRQTDPLPALLPDNLTKTKLRRDAQPLPVSAWIDGIQSQSTVCWLRHRPVLAQHVAAVAVGPDRYLVDREDAVTIVCSEADIEWVRNDVPDRFIDTVPDGDETAILAAASTRLKDRRWAAERSLAARLTSRLDGVLVVDGPLSGHQRSTALVGVIKTHPAAYLPTEWHLHSLREGEMTTPSFELLDPESRRPTGRHTCYLRLHDHRSRGVMHGLVRLEAYDPSLLPGLAATCMMFRQFNPAADARYDRHLAPIAWAEHLGRDRAPRW